MNFSYKSYFTLTLVLLTFCASGCQGQGSTCDINSTPHPLGMCGDMLSDAFTNLCNLVREGDYIDFDKRFADDNPKERLLNVPLSALAELELSFDTRDVLPGRKETPDDFTNTDALLSDSGYKQYLGRRHQPVESDGTRMQKTVLQLLTGKGYGRVKRDDVPSSLICDCCFNECTAKKLAGYCQTT